MLSRAFWAALAATCALLVPFTVAAPQRVVAAALPLFAVGAVVVGTIDVLSHRDPPRRS